MKDGPQGGRSGEDALVRTMSNLGISLAIPAGTCYHSFVSKRVQAVEVVAAAAETYLGLPGGMLAIAHHLLNYAVILILAR